MSQVLAPLAGAAVGFATGGPMGAVQGGLSGLGLGQSGKSQGAANRNQSAAQQAMQQLQGIGNLLQQRYNTAAPGEQSILNYYQNRAGLGANGNVPGGQGASLFGNPSQSAPGFGPWGSRRTSNSFPQAGAQPGLVNGNLGLFASPQYQLLRQAAQDAINQEQQLTGKTFGNSLTARGLQNSALMTGGQANIAANANKSYSDFIRNLAMNAPNAQDQLVNQYSQALQPSLNSLGEAGSLYTGAGNQALQGQQQNQTQANQLGSNFGQFLSNAAQNGALKGVGGGGSNSNPTQSQIDENWWNTMARGGPVHAGTTYRTGEEGPETYLPQSAISDLLNTFGTLIGKHMDHNKPQKAASPQVLGSNGQQMFQAKEDGVILPNGVHPNIASILQFMQQGRS